jgi:hypothetical protein
LAEISRCSRAKHLPNEGTLEEKLFAETSRYWRFLQLEKSISPLNLFPFKAKCFNSLQPSDKIKGTAFEPTILLKERSRNLKLSPLSPLDFSSCTENSMELPERSRDFKAGQERKVAISETEPERLF